MDHTSRKPMRLGAFGVSGFIASVACLFISTRAEAFFRLAEGITTIPRNELSQAKLLWDAATGCGKAIAFGTPEIPKRYEARLHREGKRIAEEPLGIEASNLFRRPGLRGDLRPPTYVRADALEEGGSRAARLVRRGLFPPLEFVISHLRSNTTPFDFYRRFFYLLRLNQIPEFLLVPPGDPHEVYFSDDILWGARVTLAEIEAHHDQLLAHPSLEHLTVAIPAQRLPRVIQWPIFRKLTSLRIEIIGKVPHASEKIIDYLKTKRQFEKLRQLTLVGDRELRTVAASPLFHLFQSANNVERLEMNVIEIDDIKSFELLKKLRVLDVSGIKFPDTPQINLETLSRFFSELNPDLEKLAWIAWRDDPFSRFHVGEALLHAPKFSQLTHLFLVVHRMSTRQMLLLAKNEALWKNVRSLSLITGPNFDRREVPALSGALAGATKLEEFAIERIFGDNEIEKIIAEVRAPLRKLELRSARLTDRGVVNLASSPAVAHLETLDAPNARINEFGANALAVRVPTLRNLVIGTGHATEEDLKRDEQMLSQFKVSTTWVP